VGISLKNVIISICHGGKWWVLKIGLKNSNLGFRGLRLSGRVYGFFQKLRGDALEGRKDPHTAIGRSKPAPSFFTSAGTRLTMFNLWI
jgi:hypothetical protein